VNYQSERDCARALALWLKQDQQRFEALQLVASLQLPQGYIAAGFIRNLVWDKLHGFSASPVNDIDVIFFDAQSPQRELQVQQQLQRLAPEFPWQVKNQAFMHLKNRHGAYQSCAQAMSYWPEVQTAVAAAVNSQGQIELCAPLGLARLFSLHLEPGPHTSAELFYQRVEQKGWLERWPKLRLIEFNPP